MAFTLASLRHTLPRIAPTSLRQSVFVPSPRLRSAALSTKHLSAFTTSTSSSLPSTSHLAIQSRSFSTSPACLKLVRKPIKYKLKTHQATKKRWRVTASGLYKRWRAGRRHYNTGLSGRHLQRLGKPTYASPAQARALRRLLPNARGGRVGGSKSRAVAARA